MRCRASVVLSSNERTHPPDHRQPGKHSPEERADLLEQPEAGSGSDDMPEEIEAAWKEVAGRGEGRLRDFDGDMAEQRAKLQQR